MSDFPKPGTAVEDDVRAIPKWADRYARNRMLPALVAMVIGALVGATIAACLALLVLTHRTGNAAGFHLCLGVTVAVVAVLAWLMATKRLQTAMQALCGRLYESDGQVVVPSAPRAYRAWTQAIAILAATLMVTTPVLVQMIHVSTRYLQPVVAAYMVPVLVVLHTRRGMMGGPLMLLWPGLYALHALLLLAGVPLPAPRDAMMNALVPLSVYGAVAILASHIYSRYALRRLRRLAEVPEDDAMGGQAQ